jgi:hypothetical protein
LTVKFKTKTDEAQIAPKTKTVKGHSIHFIGALRKWNCKMVWSMIFKIFLRNKNIAKMGT